MKKPLALITSILIGTTTLLSPLTATTASAASPITDFPGPATSNVITGPDGALWASSVRNNSIERFTTTGQISHFALPSQGATPGSLVAGSDGAIWFTEFYANKIGRITTGGSLTEFTLPIANSAPFDITAGPDGALWFTEYSGRAVGRITTSGDISEFRDSKFFSVNLFGITFAPDGNIWLTTSFYVDRMTLSGDSPTVTQYSIPGDCGPSPYLTSGPDGNLWFGDACDVHAVDRMTTSGVVTQINVPANPAYPKGVTVGPDGAIWFTETSNDKLLRVTTSGVLTTYSLNPGNSVGDGIAKGPDGAIWFTESTGIGRMAVPDINPPVVSNLTITPSVIVPSGTSSISATVIDDQSGVTAAEYYEGTDPGRGNATPMSISGSTATASVGGTLSSGTHTFNVRAEDGAGNWSAPRQVQLTVVLPAPVLQPVTTPTHQPQLSWSTVPSAASYNIYRDGSLLTNTAIGPYTDATAVDGSHTYALTAVDILGDESAQTTSNPVLVDTTGPVASSVTISPAQTNFNDTAILTSVYNPDPTGVNRIEYFEGVDPGQGNATALSLSGNTGTATLSSLAPGANTVSVRSEDGLGNWSNISTVTVAVNLLAPVLSATSPTNNAPVLMWNQVPGAANYQVWRVDQYGVTTQLSPFTPITTTNFTDTSATPGVYSYTVIAVSANGIQSPASNSVQVALTNLASPVSNSRNIEATNNNKKVSQVIPTTSDVLPGLSNGSAASASFDFRLGYPNGVFTVWRPFSFTFNAGDHDLFITSTNIDWLVINSPANTNGTFQGTATAKLDNQTRSNLPFTVTATQGTSSSSPQGAFKLTVYTDSSRSSVLYQVNDPLSNGYVNIF
jgi:virginiamycin B lyase